MSITLKRFLADEQGATAIEYGLIAAGISIAIVTVVEGVGSKTQHHLHERSDRFEITFQSCAV